MNPFDMICEVAINALSMLPFSPFGQFLDFDIPFFNLGFVNYFIPFKQMQAILVVYVTTLIFYYTVKVCMNKIKEGVGQ